MPGYLIRYAKFLGTSFVGTLVDMLVLWLLSDFAFTQGYFGEYLLSPALSFQAAVLSNFTVSYLYVWRDRVSSVKGGHDFLKRYLTYNLSCTTVFLIRLGMILIVERFTGWDVVLCNLIAMCVTGIVNFLITNNLVFRNRR